MVKFLKYSFLLLITVLFFTMCKKYPENTLWFKSPKKAIVKVWYLDNLIINGVDSTNFDDVLLFKEKGIRFESNNGLYCYEQFVGGTWTLVNKNKQIFLRLVRQVPALSGYQYNVQKNLFFDDVNLNWTIEKLNKNSLWISANSNNVKYEIHFKN